MFSIQESAMTRGTLSSMLCDGLNKNNPFGKYPTHNPITTIFLQGGVAQVLSTCYLPLV